VTQRRTHTVVDSPVGPLTLVATDGVLCGLYLDRQRYAPAPESFGVPAVRPKTLAPFTEAARQLEEYFDRRRTAFDLPLALSGTPFQRQVWEVLRGIPHARTVTYRWIADEIGRPAASRAVGVANGRNPVSIIVPCHRVIGTTGDLTGYGGGLDRKRWLLDFESGLSPRSSPR
jgi:methylated-DNA-[protein]-cysteine S-methyltransferase